MNFEPHLHVALASLLLALIVLSGFWNERRQIDRAVEKYVNLWEDDISRESLYQGSSVLKGKIVKQIYELHPAIEAVSIQGEGKQCLLHSDFTIRYGVLPSGSLQLCYSAGVLLWQSLFSPVFVIGFFLLIGFTALALRQRYQSLLAQQSLEADLHLNKELARISRQVAHDIRGPLTALQALAHLSHEMSTEKKDLMNLALDRIKGIANDLLDRSNSKDQSFQRTDSADLRTVLNDIISQYQISSPTTQIALQIPATGQPLLVGLSSLRLYRIISNLLNNALDSVEANRAEIQMTVLEKTDHWVLQIIDNGCGIPDEVMPRLTQEGFSYNKNNGSGLGLFDAKKSLQEVGGDLQIQSKLGFGTQVTLRIPSNASSEVLTLSNRRA